MPTPDSEFASAAPGQVRAAPSSVEAAALAEGERIAAAAFKSLSSNLARALQEGGVTNALTYCSLEALPLTAAVGVRHEAKIQRVSHRARNPSNRPGLDEALLLRRFQRELAAGLTPSPTTVRELGGRLVYYAPIILNNPLCLNCHGEPGRNIRPDALALIRGLYPEDKATGFRLGDLRGMWKIEFLERDFSRAESPRDRLREAGEPAAE